MAAPSLVLMGASRAMQFGQGVAQAYQQKLFAELQSEVVSNAMSEIDRRSAIDVRNRIERGDIVASEQTSAFVTGGVELDGSAMDVISDTLSNAAESAFIRQKEATYQLVQLSGQKALLDMQSSRTNFLLNVAASAVGSGANFTQDYMMQSRGGTTPSQRTPGLGESRSAGGVIQGGNTRSIFSGGR